MVREKINTGRWRMGEAVTSGTQSLVAHSQADLHFPALSPLPFLPLLHRRIGIAHFSTVRHDRST